MSQDPPLQRLNRPGPKPGAAPLPEPAPALPPPKTAPAPAVPEKAVPARNGTAPAPPKKRSSAWLWILAAICLIAGLGYYFFGRPAATPAADSATATGKHGGGRIPVLTAEAATGPIGIYLTGLGSVTPLKTATIKTRVSGQLMKVLFTEGQTVAEGDLLVQIDARPYEAQLAQEQAQLKHDQALLDNARNDEQRYQTLWSQDSISQQQLATQQALVTQDVGTVESDQALIVAAQLNITYCNITAPFPGRVGLRLIDEGNYVQPSDATGLLVLNQIQPITVIFTVAEDHVPDVLAKLKLGQPLSVDAFDRANTTKLAQGTLLTTDNQIDPTTGTLRLKAVFTNDDLALFPNQFVNVRLLLQMKQEVVLVPTAALQHGANSTFVYIVDPDARTVHLQNVTVGVTDNGQAEITQGVSEGDLVVTDGVDKLQEGSKVSLPPEKKNP